MKKNKTKPEKVEDVTVKTGYWIPESVRDEFASKCKDRGEVIQEAVAGAMMLWGYLPAEIRETARLSAKGKGDIDDGFWEDFSYGLKLGLASQLSNPPKDPV